MYRETKRLQRNQNRVSLGEMRSATVYYREEEEEEEEHNNSNHSNITCTEKPLSLQDKAPRYEDSVSLSILYHTSIISSSDEMQLSEFSVPSHNHNHGSGCSINSNSNGGISRQMLVTVAASNDLGGKARGGGGRLCVSTNHLGDTVQSKPKSSLLSVMGETADQQQQRINRERESRYVNLLNKFN